MQMNLSENLNGNNMKSYQVIYTYYRTDIDVMREDENIRPYLI